MRFDASLLVSHADAEGLHLPPAEMKPLYKVVVDQDGQESIISDPNGCSFALTIDNVFW